MVSLLAAGGAFLACGGDDSNGGGGGGGGDETGSTGGDLQIAFSPMYSAYDGVHDFKLPVRVTNVPGATFSASDKSKVDVENTAEGATLTMKGAGDVTILAEKGGLKGSAKLHITQVDPADYERGKARYTVMVDALPGFEQGGNLNPGAFGMIDRAGACTTCHGTTAKIFKVQHTPRQTGGYSDEDLIKIFTMGDKPDGYEQRSGIPDCLWGMGHRWEVPEEDRMGLIAYLRSLAPEAQGDFDFPEPMFGDGGRPPINLRGDGGTLNIPPQICTLIAGFADGGLGGLFGEGGFRFPEGGFPGFGGRREGGAGPSGSGEDAGAAPSTPPASDEDAGT